MRPRARNFLLLGIVVGGIFATLYGFLAFRLETGDSYPPYSSLRYDPLGASLLLDSLERIDEVSVRCNIEDPAKLAPPGAPGDSTVLLLGIRSPRHFWHNPIPEEHLTIARSGARVVVAFLPADPYDTIAIFRNGKSFLEEMTETDEANTSNRIKFKNLGCTFKIAGELEYDDASITARPDDPRFGDEEILAITALSFEKLSSEWKVLYWKDSEAIAIERPWGRGTLILTAASYPFSNESLFNEPSPQFIAGMIGGARDIVIDESHHGIIKSESIASLAKKHGLGPPAAGLLLLALLYIWIDATSLLPRREIRGDATLTGFDTAAGLGALLRRNIPERGLFDTIVAEWRKTANPDERKTWSEIEARRNADGMKGLSAIEQYNSAGQELAERKRKWKKKV